MTTAPAHPQPDPPTHQLLTGARKPHCHTHPLLSKPQQTGGITAMTNSLPHDDYMTAVVGALTAYGLEPDQWWSCEDDSGTPDTDRLDGIFQWRTGVADPDHWPHGVYLTWDQYDGWRLVEEGGGRNIHALSEDSGTYSHPRQIAADVRSRFDHGLDGYTPGPICIAGGYYDPAAVQASVDAWAAGA